MHRVQLIPEQAVMWMLLPSPDQYVLAAYRLEAKLSNNLSRILLIQSVSLVGKRDGGV